MKLRQAKKEVKKVARLYSLAMCYAPFDAPVLIKRITDRHFKSICYWYRHHKRNKKGSNEMKARNQILMSTIKRSL